MSQSTAGYFSIDQDLIDLGVISPPDDGVCCERSRRLGVSALAWLK